MAVTRSDKERHALGRNFVAESLGSAQELNTTTDRIDLKKHIDTMGVVARITDTADKLDPRNLCGPVLLFFQNLGLRVTPRRKHMEITSAKDADAPSYVGHSPKKAIDLRFVNLCKDMVNKKSKPQERRRSGSHSLGVQNLVTFLHECPNLPDAPYSEAVARLLQASWPAFVTLTPELVGTPDLVGDQPGTDAKDRFLHTIQMLTDSGLITYEALVMSSDYGLRVIDVALTARGRSVLRPPFRN